MLASADGLADDAAALRKLWTEAYPTHAMTAFEPDIEPVATALVRGPYAQLGPGPLSALISFGADAHQQAVRDARELLNNRPAERDDARALFAAARLAFDANPSDYDKHHVSRRVLLRIADRQTVGRRAAKPTTPDVDALVSRATDAGRWLEGHLATVHGLEPSNPTKEPHVQAKQ